MAGTISSAEKPGPARSPMARGLGAVAAERDLVVLHPRPVEPEDADMADVVVAAGVDAARDLDLQSPISCSSFSSSKRVAISCAIGIERAVASAQ